MPLERSTARGDSQSRKRWPKLKASRQSQPSSRRRFSDIKAARRRPETVALLECCLGKRGPSESNGAESHHGHHKSDCIGFHLKSWAKNGPIEAVELGAWGACGSRDAGFGSQDPGRARGTPRTVKRSESGFLRRTASSRMPPHCASATVAHAGGLETRTPRRRHRACRSPCRPLRRRRRAVGARLSFSRRRGGRAAPAKCRALLFARGAPRPPPRGPQRALRAARARPRSQRGASSIDFSQESSSAMRGPIKSIGAPSVRAAGRRVPGRLGCGNSRFGQDLPRVSRR